MINIGSDIAEIYLESNPIEQVCLGSTLIWEKGEPDYIPFEDATVHTMCATRWGDYNETVITDNGDNTVDIVVTFKSMLNTTLKKSRVISTQTNVDNTGGTYTPGTTKEAIGMTLKQCAAVTSISTVFQSQNITTFNEFQYFTSVSSLTTSAFKSCKMTAITLPSSMRTIGKQAFRLCTNLTRMIVPEGVTSTGEQWVWGCKNINLIDLPSTMRTLTGYGIQPYDSKQVNFSVICRAVTPPTLGSSSYLGKLVKVYVPDDSVDAYKAANKWKDFATKIVGLSTYSG